MSNAMIGWDANISTSTTQGGTYTALVTEPTSVTFPKVTISRNEVTHLQSPDRTREYIPGLKDPSACTYKANLIKSEFIAMKGMEGVGRWFKAETADPDGVGVATPLTATFPGYIHDIKVEEIKADEVMVVTWEIQTTGVTTFA